MDVCTARLAVDTVPPAAAKALSPPHLWVAAATVSFAIEVDGRSYEVSFAGCAQAAATADEVCRKFRLASRECGGVRAEFSALCALAQGEVT